MQAQRGALLSDAGLLREEFSLPGTGAPRLGWTLFDASDPERGTPTQAERMGDLYRRRAMYLKQVHLTDCVVLTHGALLPKAPQADGILTDRRDLLTGVSAADCLPLFLVSHAAVGVLHAGWRGVLGGILPRAVQTLRHEFGVNRRDLRLYIGPGIGPCCFEVSAAVWSCFPPEARLHSSSGLRLDLVKVVTAQWLALGEVEPATHLGRCTSCSAPKLHSYRRDGGRGRNFAFLYFPGDPAQGPA